MKNKNIFILLVIICLLTLTSCASGGGNASGDMGGDNPGGSIPSMDNDFKDMFEDLSFNQVMKYTYNDSVYIIKELKDITPIDELSNNNLSNYIFVIKEYDKIKDENVSNWTVNYKIDVSKYLTNIQLEEEFIYNFYSKIESSLNANKIRTSIDIEFYDNIFEIEKELPVDMKKDFTSVFSIDVYLPYQVINQNTSDVFYINVPIKSFLAYKNNDEITISLEEDLILSYEIFIAASNVFN